MKRFIGIILCLAAFIGLSMPCLALNESAAAAKKQPITYNKDARTISYAFVFDGPSYKNNELIEQFKTSIIASTAPNFRATFPKELQFSGDWTKDGAQTACNKALNSSATMVISTGYLTSKYLTNLPNKKKYVFTMEQYGLKDLDGNPFNPITESTKGILVFKKLLGFNKAAILMTDSYYNTRKNWNEFGKDFLPGVDYTVIPVKNNPDEVLSKIPSDCDAVIFTPLYNLSKENKKYLIGKLNEKKLYTYSTIGKEDVELGVLYGTGAIDVDKKIADALSFNIKGVLWGDKKASSNVTSYEDQIIFMNKDTAEQIGYQPHLRVLATAEVISTKPKEVLNLSTIFDKIDKQNLNIAKTRLAIRAARRTSIAAILRYLPSFNVTLGYQQYNEDYAESAKLSLPEKTGIFSLGVDQVIYSPALVTDILVKHKKLDFAKEENRLNEQTMGINVALLYVDALMMQNIYNIQKEYVKESRENLAIARTRELRGKCGAEEPLRWASQLGVSEQHLIELSSSLKNLKIQINKMLDENQLKDFDLAPLTANDPAFFTSDINIIDYVTYPAAMENFTKMLVDEVYRVSPELAKLRAAIKMKKYEMAMYYQKFVLPDAKLSFTYTSLIDADYTGELQLYQPNTSGGHSLVSLAHPESTNAKFGIYAQWKPIEGGTKIAEIARTKAELDELKVYEQEVKASLEEHVRTVINRAISYYISLEAKYKAMAAAQANYRLVKKGYNEGTISIAQLTDAQKIYLDSKVDALNSQYLFFKELIWVQRALCSVNWVKADPDAKKFIQKVKDNLEKKSDLKLL